MYVPLFSGSFLLGAATKCIVYEPGQQSVSGFCKFILVPRNEMKHTLTGYKIQQGCSSSNITVESQIHDIKLLVNETIMLNFNVCNEKSLKQSTRIAFNATKIGIILIHPSNSLITKSLTQFANIFTSKKVGKTTVSLGQLIYIEIFSLLLNLCTFLYKNKMQHFGQLATEIAVLNQSQMIFKKNDWLI